MALRINRLAIESSNVVNVNGISFSSEAQTIVSMRLLLKKLCDSFGYSAYFTLLPSVQPGEAKPLFQIKGLSFGNWVEPTNEKYFNSRDVEDVVLKRDLLLA